MKNLRILSLNIRDSGSRKEFLSRTDAITELVKSTDPDLIGVQELMDYMPEALPWLTETYGFYGKKRNSFTADERCCVLYRKERFRLLDGKTFWLSKTPEVPGSRYPLSVFPRIVTIACMEDREDGSRFTFANTHLDHLLPDSRLRQCRVLSSLLHEHRSGSFLILTGDFNSTAADPGARILLEDPDLHLRNIADPDARSSIKNLIQSAASHYRPIDLIMASDHLETVNAHLCSSMYCGKYPSDHMPLSAELSIPESD